MATTLTSAIINVNISKLKKDLEAIGNLKVLEISPKNGSIPTSVTMSQSDGFSDLTPSQQSDAQAIIDSHSDTQDEDLSLIGRDDFVFGNKQLGTISIQNNGINIWQFNTGHNFVPTSDTYGIGLVTARIGPLYGTSANFSGDVSTGNLTVNGTLTYINTENLNISDNKITLNADWIGPPTEDAGIIIERGSSADALLLWNESTDRWQIGIDGGTMEDIAYNSVLSSHIGNTDNPHSVTKTQVGLGNVTNDAQLKRASGDLASFTLKTSLTADDIFIIEDSAASFAKKSLKFSELNSQLIHQNLSGAGTNTHSTIDSHLASTSNPHSVTKTQVGLGNVTNDAQLKRAAGDYSTFPVKSSPTINDLLLIEDFAESNAKKYIAIGSLPFTLAGTLDGYTVYDTPSDGKTIKFVGSNNRFEYVEEGVAKKIVNDFGAIPIDSTSIPDDMEYLRYDAASGKIKWDVAPGVSSSGPIGSILPFGGSTPPQGFLLCDGSAVSRIFYNDLFAVIGTTYGPGDGVNTFNLPDLRQKFLLGKAVSGTGSTLGEVGGSIDHNHSLPTAASTPTGGTGLILTSTATGSANPPYVVVNYIIKYSDNLLAQGNQNIAGNLNFDGILSQKTHSNFTNSQITQKTFAIQTIGASQSVALSQSLFDNAVTWFEVKIVARYESTSINKNYWARVFGGVRRNNGSAAVLIDDPEILENATDNPSNYKVDIGVNGNNLEILVTGATGETVNWAGTIQYQSVSLAS